MGAGGKAQQIYRLPGIKLPQSVYCPCCLTDRFQKQRLLIHSVPEKGGPVAVTGKGPGDRGVLPAGEPAVAAAGADENDPAFRRCKIRERVQNELCIFKASDRFHKDRYSLQAVSQDLFDIVRVQRDESVLQGRGGMSCHFLEVLPGDPDFRECFGSSITS